MSSITRLFNKPRGPDLPPEPEPVEEIATIQEDATEAGRREKKKILSRRGRKSTILSGIQSALKRRLGE